MIGLLGDRLSISIARTSHIYGLERSDGSTGIVMELVDGETLVERSPKAQFRQSATVRTPKRR